MMQEKIDRINALYHKSQAVGLTEEEKKEQHALRQEYVQAIRASLRGSLDIISIKEADGSITDLGERYGKKMKGVRSPKIWRSPEMGEDQRARRISEMQGDWKKPFCGAGSDSCGNRSWPGKRNSGMPRCAGVFLSFFSCLKGRRGRRGWAFPVRSKEKGPVEGG